MTKVKEATTSAKSCKEKQRAKKIDDEKEKSATLKRIVLDFEQVNQELE